MGITKTPGIPRVYPWMDDGLAMEYIEGQVIADALMDMDKDGEAHQAILDYITELLGIFAQLHKMNIVHRDIHERNILRSTAGHMHIIDFGLAQFQPDPLRYRIEVCDLWTLTQTWIDIYLSDWPFQHLVLERYTTWFERLHPRQHVCATDLLTAWQVIRRCVATDELN